MLSALSTYRGYLLLFWSQTVSTFGRFELKQHLLLAVLNLNSIYLRLSSFFCNLVWLMRPRFNFTWKFNFIARNVFTQLKAYKKSCLVCLMKGSARIQTKLKNTNHRVIFHANYEISGTDFRLWKSMLQIPFLDMKN